MMKNISREEQVASLCTLLGSSLLWRSIIIHKDQAKWDIFLHFPRNSRFWRWRPSNDATFRWKTHRRVHLVSITASLESVRRAGSVRAQSSLVRSACLSSFPRIIQSDCCSLFSPCYDDAKALGCAFKKLQHMFPTKTVQSSNFLLLKALFLTNFLKSRYKYHFNRKK